jgi:hypothetical protein
LIKYQADTADKIRKAYTFFEGVLFPNEAQKSAFSCLFGYYAESIQPKIIRLIPGSGFRVQGSKVIVYFTRVPGSGFRVDNL